MPTIKLVAEDGEELRTVEFRYLMAGQAGRAFAHYLHLGDSVQAAAKGLPKELPKELSALTEYVETVAKMQDQQQAAIGVLLAKVMPQLDSLPASGTAEERGLAAVQALLDDGWSPAEIEAVGDMAAAYVRNLGMSYQVSRKVKAVSDFSAPQTD